MTEIAFHFNAPARVAYACRLLRKASATGSRLLVTGDPATLRELDAALWTFSATDFVAHCLAGASTPALTERTPILLSTTARDAAGRQVLVNLGDEVPTGFEAFERLIEVVTVDEAVRHRARARWKHYADRGYPIVRHDLQLKESV